MHTGVTACYNMFYAGRPLSQVCAEMDDIYQQLLLYKQDVVAMYFVPRYQQVLNLRAYPPVVDKDKMCQKHKKNNDMDVYSLLFFEQARGETAYVMREYHLAKNAFKKAKGYLKNCMSGYGPNLTYFYEALVLLALGQEYPDKKRKMKREARQNYKHLQKFRSHSPENWANKFLLMDAEFLVLDGAIERSSSIFENSIRTAAKEGFIQEEALACERYSLALFRQGFNMSSARFYMDRAMELYRRWGASIKVVQLETKQMACRKVGIVRNSSNQTVSTGSVTAASSTFSTGTFSSM